MITKLIIENFKSISYQEFEFSAFDLLVGRNNSGKSTILQALAIWQFCVDEFRTQRKGSQRKSNGIQISLPTFTALPVPEFNLLWKNKTDRRYVDKQLEYLPIRIAVEWQKAKQQHQFSIDLRYQSAVALFAKPTKEWKGFQEIIDELPKIVYVPPFSGLEIKESYVTDAVIRQKIGMAQPGSVLRNLLWRVYVQDKEWKNLNNTLHQWFGIRLNKIDYEQEKHPTIQITYCKKDDKKEYDIISAGSGLHQTLILLAFLYGYNPDTLLLDEPDAHLHVNLQRQVVDFFQTQKKAQFLIATHAEEFMNGVAPEKIIVLTNSAPKRLGNLHAKDAAIASMKLISNEEIVQAQTAPLCLYVEGRTDERILRAWFETCNINTDCVSFMHMRGGSEKYMREQADQHFKALKAATNQKLKRLIIFDRDNDLYEPKSDNQHLYKWSRRNIENYLLVPPAWQRAVAEALNIASGDLFLLDATKTIEDFFAQKSLMLPPTQQWRSIKADAFAEVDGKKILFESDTSLHHQLRHAHPNIVLNREAIAAAMQTDEIHDDIHILFDKIKTLSKTISLTL